MRDPLLRTYEAMPEPRWVMAVGACAISGGVSGGGYACANGLEGILPVDLYLPGCPPNPAALIGALLDVPRAFAPTRGRRTPCRMTSWRLAACAGLPRRRLGLPARRFGWRGRSSASAELAVVAAALSALPGGTDAVSTPLGIDGLGSRFFLSPSALWLMGFGLPSAILAAWLGTPAKRQAQWIFGAAASLIGALGVFGMQDAATFLISWEIMSLGGAVMLLGENLSSDVGRPALFMLALLEAGAVALILAFILLANQAGSLSFSDFAAAMRALPLPQQYFVALLLLIGFGAKLGLLPFYEWFPGAYGSGSGATGAFLSGRHPQRRLLFSEPLSPRLAADPRRDGPSRCPASLSSPSPSSARFSPPSTPSRKKGGGSC